MENKKVSIIIPCYNHELYVKQALDSVLNDNYPEKEIIIIDDGSSDNSVEVIKNWIAVNKNKIDITFKYRENRGVTATLNELKSLATGKYISIMASDDYLIENSIAKRMEILIKNPEKKLIFGDAHVVDGKNQLLMESSIEDFHHGNKESLKNDDGILNAALFNPVFSGALFIMEKDIYNIIGDYPEDLLIEDWYFWQRVAIFKLAIFFNDYVSCYRRHGENITADSSKTCKIIKGIVQTCEINIKLIKDKKIKTKFKKSIFKYKLIIFKYELKNRFKVKKIN